MIRHDHIPMEVAVLPVKHVFNDLRNFLPYQPLRPLLASVQIAIHPHKGRTAVHFSRRRIALPRQASSKVPSDKQSRAFIKNMWEPAEILHPYLVANGWQTSQHRWRELQLAASASAEVIATLNKCRPAAAFWQQPPPWSA